MYKEDPARPVQGSGKWLTWHCSIICYKMSSQQIIPSKSSKLIGLDDELLGSMMYYGVLGTSDVSCF